jgi:hypothetical protein
VESGLESIEAMTQRCASLIARLLGDAAVAEKDFMPYPISVIWRKDVLQVTEDLLESRAKRIEARTGGFADAKAHMLEAYAREFLQPIWRTFEGEAERSFHSQQQEGRGQSWHAMKLLLRAAAAGDAPMGVHIVVHGSGMPWLLQLVERLCFGSSDGFGPVEGLQTPEQRRKILQSITLLAPICTVEQVEEMVTSLWGDWRLPKSETPPPLAIYTQPPERDAVENLGGYSGSFLELARRCFPIDGSIPTFTKPNKIAGHAEGAKELEARLGATGLLEIMQTSTQPTAGHADLMADPLLIEAVLSRIRAVAVV